MSRIGWVAGLLAFETMLGFLGAALPARGEARHGGAAPIGKPWARHVIDDAIANPDGVRLADIDGDGFEDVATGFEAGGLTRVLRHPGPMKVRERWPAVTVGKTPTAEDAVFVDLDGDGASDVVTSTEGEERRVYVAWGPADRAALLDARAWHQDRFTALDGRMQAMYALPLDVDGRRGIDLVVGGKSDDPARMAQLGWLESPKRPRDTSTWRWHRLTADVHWVMAILPEDMDGDGDLDLVFTDKHGPFVGLHWLERPGSAAPARRSASDVERPWKKHTIAIPDLLGTSFATIADLDGDGLRDVVVGTTLRDATALPTSRPSAPASDIDGASPAAPPDPRRHALVLLRRLDASGERFAPTVVDAPAGTGSPKGVSAGDVDGDGRLDLVVSCSGADGELVGVYWLRAQGAPFAHAWVAHDVSGPLGIKFDLVPLADLDRDGDLDVLSTEEKEAELRGLGVVWYENPGPAR